MPHAHFEHRASCHRTNPAGSTLIQMGTRARECGSPSVLEMVKCCSGLKERLRVSRENGLVLTIYSQKMRTRKRWSEGRPIPDWLSFSGRSR